MSLDTIQSSLDVVRVTLENIDARLKAQEDRLKAQDDRMSSLETLDARIKYVKVFNKSQFSCNRLLLHQISIIQNHIDDASKGVEAKNKRSENNYHTTVSASIFDPTFENDKNAEEIESVGKKFDFLVRENIYNIESRPTQLLTETIIRFLRFPK